MDVSTVKFAYKRYITMIRCIALQSTWPGTWTSDLNKGTERCVMFMNRLSNTDTSLVFNDKLCSNETKAIIKNK